MNQLKKFKEYHHSDQEFNDLNKVIGKLEKENNRLRLESQLCTGGTVMRRVEDMPKEWQKKYHKAHAQLKESFLPHPNHPSAHKRRQP